MKLLLKSSHTPIKIEESKQAFVANLGLGFSILVDNGDQVRTTFVVKKALFGQEMNNARKPGRGDYWTCLKIVCSNTYSRDLSTDNMLLFDLSSTKRFET